MNYLSMSKVMKVIPASAVLKISRQILVFKKNSPHIFFGAGIVGTVTSTVLACKATLKLSDTLDEIQNDLTNVKELRESTEVEVGASAYSDADYHMDTVYVYSKASTKLIKLYGPAILIGAASIGALTGSHIQLTRRNSALMAAYAAVAKAYDDYRERVRDQLGEERELDIYNAARTEVVKNTEGVKEEHKIIDPNKYSPYAKFFDEFSKFWERDPEVNRIYVQCQQNYANDLLRARGHVFLNEVYDMLDVERSKAGQVVGWVVDGDGDGYVSFGIFEGFNSRFVNGIEQSILLDFNVDGVIWDKI